MDEATIIKTYSDGINAVVSLVKDLNGQILVLTRQVDTLNKRITELEARLNKNSGNSDKPPSSDGYKKPQNNRQKTGKPTGGQWGHEGKTLKKVQNPDEVIEYKTPGECDCGCDLHDVKYTKKPGRCLIFQNPR